MIVRLLWLCWIVVALGCANEPTTTATTRIDFHKEVAPIFKARCWNCHGPQQQLGGLRLDDKSSALTGGLSGRKLAEPPNDDSELLRRVTSDDPTVVMPKEGGRLSEHELKILRRWVTSNAPWPEKTPPSGRDEFLARYGDDLLKRLTVVGGEPKIYLLLLFALFVGVSARLQRVPADSPRWSKGLLRFVRSCYPNVTAAAFSAVMLSVILWDVVEFSMRLSADLATTRSRLVEAGPASDLRPTSLNGARPKPLRPRGATGFGGTYYRGNDERSEKLFNNGYYRTAALRLALIDEHDQPLSLGKTVTGSQLFIRLEIKRAAQAAPALFTDKLMQAIRLTRRTADDKSPLPNDEPVRLGVLQPGERWGAKYHLGEFTGQSEIALNGTVYLYAGVNEANESALGQIQYGIVYCLRIRDRTLLENSELWLGTVLVPSNFQYPSDDKIPLAEWLDTNPIPEITGEQTSDPQLLGVPDHIK